MKKQNILRTTLTESVKTGKDATLTVILILVAAAAFLGGAASLARGNNALAFPSDTVRFVNPRSVHADSAGNLLVIDSGERRILGISPDGTLRFQIPGLRKVGGFYMGRMVGFDSGNRFYIDDTILDLASSNTAARRCLKYDTNGNFIDTMFNYEYKEEEMGDWEIQPIFVQVRDDALYWLLKGSDGIWNLHSKPLEKGGVEKAFPIEGIDVYTCLDASVISQEEVYFLLPDGSISFARTGSPSVTVYPHDGAKNLKFPSALALDPRGRVLAVDGKREITRIDFGKTPPAASLILDRKSAKRSGYAPQLSFMDLSSDADGTIRVANEYTGDLVAFPSSGMATVMSSALTSFADKATAMAAFAAAWAALAALASAIVILYFRIFRYKAPLVVKQLAVFVPLIAAMTVAVAALVYRSTSEPLEISIMNRLRHLSQLGSSEIAPEDIDALRFEGVGLAEIKQSPSYERIYAVVNRLINENKDPWNSNVYDYLYRKDGDSWWITGSFDYIELYPYVKSEFEKVIETGEPAWLRYSDIYGAWLSALSPVFGADGKPKAVLEATMSADILDEASRAFVTRSMEGGLAIIIAFVAAFIAFTTILLRSVKSMKAGAERIAEGDYGRDVVVRSRDEIEDLGDAFNAMSKEIRDNIGRITSLYEANARFVPKGFLAHLGKNDITEIRLGDQAQAEMTVMFTDIRSFTDLSELMTPSEVFSFLNDYLRRMGPEIRGHGGFIDKYIGDAIMALFPGRPENAIEAVYGMSARLVELNAERTAAGMQTVGMGIGIHRGPLMIGVIGEEMRFDGTVISDAVNLASRLESLTKYYGVRSIVSESTWESLSKPETCPSRFLDAVRVKGRFEVVRLRELLLPGEADSDAKKSYLKSWDTAWEYYRKGHFSEALASYEAILGKNPTDAAAKLFRDRCSRMLSGTVPDSWDGITTFGEK